MKDKAIFLAAFAATFAASAAVTADFTKPTAKFRPALHSSGYAPNFLCNPFYCDLLLDGHVLAHGRRATISYRAGTH